MINSREIEDLHLYVQQLYQLFLAECNLAGIEVMITSTYRDMNIRIFSTLRGGWIN